MILDTMQRLRLTPFLSALALLLLVSATGCDFSTLEEDLEDTLELRIGLPEAETTIAAALLDAATNEVVTTPVTIRIEGPDQNLVVDPYLFNPIGSSTVETGLLAMALRDEAQPSTSNPAEFVLVAEAPGYIATSLSVMIED